MSVYNDSQPTRIKLLMYFIRQVVLFMLVVSQMFLPIEGFVAAGMTAPEARPAHFAAPTREQELQPTSTPDPLALEPAAFIQRRQYPERFPAPVLLPDLRSLRPADLRTVLATVVDRRFLHFSTAFWNRGPGVLELIGRPAPGREHLHVSQVLYREDGSSVEKAAGNFEFESDHGHWHWENFSRYELWTVAPQGLDELVAENDKVGFCLRDVSVYSVDREHVRLPAGTDRVGQLFFDSCHWEKQGLSVGWSDIYRANIPGQYVEITGLPDGLYALKTTIDPADTILESDEHNNAAIRYILLEAGQVRSLPADFAPAFLTVEFD
jgi:hypothetical protein